MLTTGLRFGNALECGKHYTFMHLCKYLPAYTYLCYTYAYYILLGILNLF